MKIIIDSKIPYIKGVIERIAKNAEVDYLSGKDFTTESVQEAEALIIRTRTKCNSQLLENSKVKFIATATIGYDHIDTKFCDSKNIAWTNAPGCNSASVAQYVQSALIEWSRKLNKELHQLTIGIIGVGNVGSKVATVAQNLGMKVMLNDLPREEKEGCAHFTSLNTIAEKCDIITFHTPLHKEGKYKTFHLGDQSFFSSLQKCPLIINTSRGEVIETEAILDALEKNYISDAIIDVWENEPNINRELLKKAFISTPHIAGYSADGKANATRMSLDSFCKFFKIEAQYEVIAPKPDSLIIQASSMEEALLKIYSPIHDSTQLKAHPEQFESFRENYPLRREPETFEIILNNPSQGNNS